MVNWEQGRKTDSCSVCLRGQGSHAIPKITTPPEAIVLISWQPLFFSVYRWFTHFYIWGSIWTYALFVNFLLHCITGSNHSIPIVHNIFSAVIGDRECGEGITQHHFDTFVVLFLLCVQVTRRLYECFYVSILSPAAKMHPIHYLLGVYFYSMVGPTALLHMSYSKYIIIITMYMISLYDITDMPGWQPSFPVSCSCKPYTCLLQHL